MKGIFYFKDGVLKRKTGFFVDRIFSIVPVCIAVMAGGAFLLISSAPYLQKFIEILTKWVPWYLNKFFIGP